MQIKTVQETRCVYKHRYTITKYDIAFTRVFFSSNENAHYLTGLYIHDKLLNIIALAINEPGLMIVYWNFNNLVAKTPACICGVPFYMLNENMHIGR